MTHSHRQWCADSRREGWVWVDVGKGRDGDICNSVDNKVKKDTKHFSVKLSSSASSQTPTSSNHYPEVYHHALVLPVLDPYRSGIIHRLWLLPVAQCF